MLHLAHKIYSYIRSKLLRLLNASTVGVRAIVINEKNQVLLVKHTYMKDWYLPGGGVKNNETLTQAIIRELHEETGVQTKNPQLWQIYLHKLNNVSDYPALFIVKEFTQIKVYSAEIMNSQWFDINDLPADISPKTQQRIQEYFFQAPQTDHW